LSWNTIGAKGYSDGKVIAPMCRDFPDLTKCKKCDSIFWLSGLKEIGTFDYGKKEQSEWPDADDAEFLGLDDYFRALDTGIAKTNANELFIRFRILWAYNDRYRKCTDMFIDKNDEKKWKENCEKIVALVDQSDIGNKLLVAEIKRNFGDFQGCLDIINSIDDSKYNFLKKKFIEECEKGNRWVICFR